MIAPVTGIEDKVRFLTGVHQRFADTLFEIFATGNNVDVEGIESSVFDFDPGVLMVVGTPHLGNGYGIFPSNLFDRRIELQIQIQTSHNLDPIGGNRAWDTQPLASCCGRFD
jgi:hypothetical protein